MKSKDKQIRELERSRNMFIILLVVSFFITILFITHGIITNMRFVELEQQLESCQEEIEGYEFENLKIEILSGEGMSDCKRSYFWNEGNGRTGLINPIYEEWAEDNCGLLKVESIKVKFCWIENCEVISE